MTGRIGAKPRRPLDDPSPNEEARPSRANCRRSGSRSLDVVIEVVEYDPTWPERFGRLRDLYASVMAEAGVPVVSIEHVGSTAVPGLAAKPIHQRTRTHTQCGMSGSRRAPQTL
jgi:hypothetical protein